MWRRFREKAQVFPLTGKWETGTRILGNNSSLRKMDMRICLGQEKKAGRGRFMKSRKLCPKAGTCLTGKTAWKIWKKQMRNTWRK